MKIHRVSYHGGHSKQYCAHAKNTLEEIIEKYISLGFKAVGISEHVPPVRNELLYPDEIELNLTVQSIYERFENYIAHLRQLKTQYASQINIFIGMETEACSGYLTHMKNLVRKFEPDYIVGSVHHINDICFDFSKKEYDRAARECGSYDALYESYFDLQYEMLLALKPFLVGHFDLIRIFDSNYETRITTPDIWKKILRNLKFIKSMNMALDFNLRPLKNGGKEPYVMSEILKCARKFGISAVPGDDSHGMDEAGMFVDKAIDILDAYGFNLNWPEPRLLSKYEREA